MKCKGITKKGTPCQAQAKANDYCKRHHRQALQEQRQIPIKIDGEVVMHEWRPKKKTDRVRRPDVAARLRERKNIVETVVTASLPGRIGKEWNEDCREILRDEINKWILSTSQITHRLSLFFNRLLIYLLQHNKTLPAFNDALFTGMAMCGMKKTSKTSKEDYATLIQDFYDNEFNTEYGQFPTITRQRGDCQAIVIAANKYKTNFLNACQVPFYNRQISFINVWLRVHNIEITDKIAKHIQWAINGWRPRNYEPPAFSQVVEQFISDQRQILGNPINVNETWLERNVATVITYYYHVLKFYTEAGQGRKFTLAPVSRIKCHFLTIDKTVLRELLINVRSRAGDLFPSDVSAAIDTDNLLTDEVWKSVFDYEGLRQRRRFGYQVETDGVKICFHFQYTKKKAKKSSKRRRYKQQHNTVQRVIAIDPGRANLITAYDTESEEYFRLSRGEYYSSSGMNSRLKRVQARMLHLKGLYEAMSKTPTRSASERDWYLYQQLLTKHYDRIWKAHTTVASRRDAFRVSCLKQRCLDRFFNKFIKDGEKPIVAYGASSFNPTGKGEKSVPVKYVYKKCCERFHTVKEDERFSTKMHYKCQQTTTCVALEKPCFGLRGLRWCPTCRELVSRDPNACKNIAFSFQQEERPAYLCDTYPRPEHIPTKILRMGASTQRAVSTAYNRMVGAWRPRQRDCFEELLTLFED